VFQATHMLPGSEVVPLRGSIPFTTALFAPFFPVQMLVPQGSPKAELIGSGEIAAIPAVGNCAEEPTPTITVVTCALAADAKSMAPARDKAAVKIFVQFIS
jgi:hypothetical protein